MMAAYFIIYLQAIKDPAALAEYRKLAVPAFAKSDAIVRVRGGRAEVLEGDPVQHVVMLEFPNLEAARAWYDSPEYQSALKHRLAAASSYSILVEGV
jgi:uncharacterized protein (DUF1330 family)